MLSFYGHLVTCCVLTRLQQQIWLTLHVFYLLLPTDTHIKITTWDCSWTVFGHRGRCLTADERSGVSCICPPSGRQQ